MKYRKKETIFEVEKLEVGEKSMAKIQAFTGGIAQPCSGGMEIFSKQGRWFISIGSYIVKENDRIDGNDFHIYNSVDFEKLFEKSTIEKPLPEDKGLPVVDEIRKMPPVKPAKEIMTEFEKGLIEGYSTFLLALLKIEGPTGTFNELLRARDFSDFEKVNKKDADILRPYLKEQGYKWKRVARSMRADGNIIDHMELKPPPFCEEPVVFIDESDSPIEKTVDGISLEEIEAKAKKCTLDGFEYQRQAARLMRGNQFVENMKKWPFPFCIDGEPFPSCISERGKEIKFTKATSDKKSTGDTTYIFLDEVDNPPDLENFPESLGKIIKGKVIVYSIPPPNPWTPKPTRLERLKKWFAEFFEPMPPESKGYQPAPPPGGRRKNPTPAPPPKNP